MVFLKQQIFIAMKIFILLLLCFSANFLKAQTLGSSQFQKDSLENFEYFERIGMDSTMKLWKMDPNGCKNIRTWIMGLYIVKNFDFMNLSEEKVISLIGPPTLVTYDSTFLGSIREERRFIFYNYIGQQFNCKEDLPPEKPNCGNVQIRLVIHPSTRKVVSF